MQKVSTDIVPMNENSPKLSPRARRLLDTFHLTESQWQRIYDFQKGLCAICHNPMRKPNVDHCHKTGLIRGLLCPRCNRALGRFGDSIVLIRAALAYLLIPPAVEALGITIYGLTGRVGTKRQRKMIKRAKKQNLTLAEKSDTIEK